MTTSDPVYDASRVEVLDSTQHLVEEVGHAFMVQVHLYHLAQVSIHQLHHKVHILEFIQGLLRCECIEQPNDL